MARKRMIDPSFWTDEKVGTVEPRARLLFMGLISQADDSGRLSGHPALIKSLIFPYDYDITLLDVEKWIGLIAERNLIRRYEVNSQKYILITNFNKHQTINRPQPSKLPEPTDETIMNDHGLFSDDSMNDHAQKNLKEDNLKEDKANTREENSAPPPDDVETIKSNLHKLVNQSEIENYTLFDLDEIYSYIGVVDVEIIEAAIKKSKGKSSIKYCINTLKGMIKEGFTKKEHLYPKPAAGKAPTNVTSLNRGWSRKPEISIVSDNLETEEVSAEEMEDLRKLARKLEGKALEA